MPVNSVPPYRSKFQPLTRPAFSRSNSTINAIAEESETEDEHVTAAADKIEIRHAVQTVPQIISERAIDTFNNQKFQNTAQLKKTTIEREALKQSLTMSPIRPVNKTHHSFPADPDLKKDRLFNQAVHGNTTDAPPLNLRRNTT